MTRAHEYEHEREYAHEQHTHKHKHKHEHGGLDDLHAALDTTPAFEAAREGDVAALALALALDANADANANADTNAAQLTARDKYGFTLLHWACDRGQESTAALLLARGADINAVEKRLFKRTPLLLAALSGNSTLVQLLLRHGANTAAADYKGWRAVHCAAHAGSIDALRALVAAGARLDELTKRNESVLHLAARMGHTALVSELVGSSDGSSSNSSNSANSSKSDSSSSSCSNGNNTSEDSTKDTTATVRDAPDSTSQVLRMHVRSETISVRDTDGAAAVNIARASGHGDVVAILSGASNFISNSNSNNDHSYDDHSTSQASS